MLNLSDRLKLEFKSKGIVAFSFCCRPGCSGTYDEDSEFDYRKNGIFFIRLHLSGMNFDANPDQCSVYYSNFNYLIKNWKQEEDILHDWCKIVGLLKNDYQIIKPNSENNSIIIKFKKQLLLKDNLIEEQENNNSNFYSLSNEQVNDLFKII